MLVASADAGWPLDSYRSRSHPHHRQLLPLVRAARRRRACARRRRLRDPRARASAAGARDAVRADGGRRRPTTRRSVRVLDAMHAEPYLVGGRDRDDTAVMEAAPDLVMKEGAEALNCVLARTRGIGVAVKIARRRVPGRRTGDDRGAPPARAPPSGRPPPPRSAWRPTLPGGDRPVRPRSSRSSPFRGNTRSLGRVPPHRPDPPRLVHNLPRRPRHRMTQTGSTNRAPRSCRCTPRRSTSRGPATPAG